MIKIHFYTLKNLDSEELLESGAYLSQVMNLLMDFRNSVRLFATLQMDVHLYVSSLLIISIFKITLLVNISYFIDKYELVSS